MMKQFLPNLSPGKRVLCIPSVAVLLLLAGCSRQESTPAGWPQVLDERLHIELIAEHPQLVTPIGMAIDAQDQVYILESHTHSPLKDYTGPAFDRILKGIDADGDGRPESWQVFADSIVDGMNLAFGPSQTLYLAQKDRVMAFLDHDGDGASDEARLLLRMDPPENVYDHAGILGVAVPPDGWLYVSRGNTGGHAWRIQGSDGSALQGYGDGGNLMRCRPDGSAIEEVATGFWNPFGLAFSQEGRLLLTDNDPDSRGPNRLIDIVPGGDYGYQSLYGGSGIHPYLAWNGELPGTLPYVAALGEAPTGLIDAGATQFPPDYRNNVLCGIWEENNIVRIPLESWHSSVLGTPQILVQGDSTFHPVAFAVNSKGELYFTDWVVRQYPNHGKGRLWRLTARNAVAPQALKTSASVPKAGLFFSRLAQLRDREAILAALGSDDPFVQALARRRLAEVVFEEEALALIGQEDAQLRMQGLLALFRSAAVPSRARLQALLRDEDEQIRRMALIYTGAHLREDLLPDVQAALYSGQITPALFETYLATLQHLQPDFIRDYRAQAQTASKNLPLRLPPGYLPSLIQDERLPAAIRAAALPYLEQPDSSLAVLTALLESGPAPMQEGLLQALKTLPDARAAAVMLNIALDEQRESSLRTQAVVSLGYQPERFCAEVAPLASATDDALSLAAMRYLCRCGDDKTALAAAAVLVQKNPQSAAAEAWQLCRGEAGDRPASDNQWETLASGGDPQLGKWVFQSPQAQCQRCHKMDGWGGAFGPDLSNVGSSKSQQQLITAILQPSAEISPEWQGWYVTTQEGETHFGRQIDVGFKDVKLMNADGEFVTYSEPPSYGLAPVSLMPEGLENALTKAEFRHLIAYLVSLK